MPSDDPTALMRAQAAIAVEDWPAAERALRKASKSKDATPEVFYNFAKVLVLQGKNRQAAAAFERAIAMRPAYSAAWFELGRLHIEERAFAQARDAFARVTSLTPDDTDALEYLAVLSERLGDFETSTQAWQVVLNREPGHAAAQLGLLRAALERRQDAVDGMAEALLSKKATRAAATTLLSRTSRGWLRLERA